VREGEPLILWDWTFNHVPEIGRRVLEHMELTGIAVCIGFVLAFALSLAIRQIPALYAPVTWVTGVLYTIPSLALFGFLIPVPWIGGVGASTAIVALALYALLPILRNTCTGIEEVDAAVIESARGMGMTPGQVLWQVELPLAAPILLAGIRVATVLCIGVTTIAAAIGAGGLGVFIFRGVSMVNNQVILAGAIPAALLAVLADTALGVLQWRVAKQ